MVNWCAIDLETTVKNTEVGPKGGDKPSPFWPDNYIVMDGWQWADENLPKTSNRMGHFGYFDEPICLVGHNIKFDLHYLRNMIGQQTYGDWIRAGGRVWDTMICEYILSGQQKLFPGLNETAPIYGGTEKEDKVKELWDQGVQTEDIDEDLLREYLKSDVKNTRTVFLNQLPEAKEKKNLLKVQMEALLAVEEMEYNGMYVDVEKLTEHKRRTRGNLEHLQTILSSYFSYEASKINFDSREHISALLFGGKIKYTEKEFSGYYKTGKKAGEPKYKNVHKELKFKGMSTPRPEWTTPKEGVYSVDEEVLRTLAVEERNDFAEDLLNYRKLSKELNTYIHPLFWLIYPDNCVHHKLHQVSTYTGRLSSSGPNAQNLPAKEDSQLKSVFTSRFKEGYIIEADFKQIEIIVLAILSQDPQLNEDIKTGRDIHTEVGKKVFIGKMSKDDRRIVKTCVFGLIYGGTVPTLAAQSNLSRRLVQNIIDAFFARYPDVKLWQHETYEFVKSLRTYHGDETKSGKPAGRGVYAIPTGRHFVFYEQDAPSWAKEDVNFSPTKIKNYPVQGFAADIVQMTMGKLFREIYRKNLDDKIKMINQVHDAILFDCKSLYCDAAVDLIRREMESVPKLLKMCYDIETDLPFKVEISAGPDWKNQTEVELS